jgi:uncharacterized membrane protein
VSVRALLLIVFSQIALVGGQLFLKHGMNLTQLETKPKGRIACNITAGIVSLTLWFFLWMGLMQKLDLSHLYPFEGLSPALLVIASCIILKERLDIKSWGGVFLIAVGTLLVGFS